MDARVAFEQNCHRAAAAFVSVGHSAIWRYPKLLRARNFLSEFRDVANEQAGAAASLPKMEVGWEHCSTGTGWLVIHGNFSGRRNNSWLAFSFESVV